MVHIISSHESYKAEYKYIRDACQQDRPKGVTEGPGECDADVELVRIFGHNSQTWSGNSSDLGGPFHTFFDCVHMLCFPVEVLVDYYAQIFGGFGWCECGAGKRETGSWYSGSKNCPNVWLYCKD